MSRLGAAWGLPVALSKAITISAESNAIELTYLLENLPPNRSFHFGVEFHFTALIELGRNGTFRDARRNPIAKLDRPIDLDRVDGIALDDTDAGLQIDLTIDRPSSLWGFPITPAADHTDHVPAPQAVCLIPHWQVRGDDAGRWAVKMTCRVAIDDRRASELRMTGLAPAPAPFAAAVG
jgi:alpha-amylase